MKIYLMNPCMALINAIKNKKSTHYPNPRGWTQKRIESVRDRDNHTCQLCGEKQGSRAFHVHHKDENRYNCNPDNLITLCPRCHALESIRLKKGGN